MWPAARSAATAAALKSIWQKPGNPYIPKVRKTSRLQKPVMNVRPDLESEKGHGKV
jgi:hypothetical protein